MCAKRYAPSSSRHRRPSVAWDLGRLKSLGNRIDADPVVQQMDVRLEPERHRHMA
jgi:hypothetical protein